MLGRKLPCGVMTVCILMVLAAAVFAQDQAERPRAGHGWGPHSDYRLFDPATVETVTGQVIELTNLSAQQGAGRGIHLTLKTTDGSIAIHLGPAWFIEQQDLQVKVNDRIAVTGSRVSLDGKPALIAAEVEMGDQILVLRDEEGIPRWSASRDRRPRIGRGPGGWGRNTQYVRNFDAATVETVTGQVVDIAYFTPRQSPGRGIHLTLKAEHETIPVHLGPAWFMENQEFQIQPGDTIAVRGSRVTVDGEMVIIAAEIQKGEDVLELRDADGRPRWSGSRRTGR